MLIHRSPSRLPTRARVALLGALAVMSTGCGVLDGKLLGGAVPRHGSLIPNTRLQLTPGFATSVETLAVGAAAAGTLYYVYQPLDPNWEGADLPVSNEVYRLSLRMKRFHTGGDGEALQVARRYAEQLQVARGASGYTIVEFAQGIESSTPIARRVAEAIVRLKDVPAPTPAEIEGPPWPIRDEAAPAGFPAAAAAVPATAATAVPATAAAAVPATAAAAPGAPPAMTVAAN